MRVSTQRWLEKKILLPLLPGIKPMTFWSKDHHCTSWAILSLSLASEANKQREFISPSLFQLSYPNHINGFWSQQTRGFHKSITAPAELSQLTCFWSQQTGNSQVHQFTVPAELSQPYHCPLKPTNKNNSQAHHCTTWTIPTLSLASEANKQGIHMSITVPSELS